MIRTNVDIPESGMAINQPVVQGVADDIVSFIGISDDTHLTISPDNAPFKNKNWNLGNLVNKEDQGLRNEVVIVAYDESFDDSHAITTNIRHNDSKPVIYDPITKLELTPIYIESTMRFNMKLMTKSKADLVKMLSKLRMLYIENRDISHHTIEYIYHLDKRVYPLLKAIMDIQNDVMDTDIYLEEFLVPMVDDRFTFTSNQSGTLDNIQIAFKELKTGVVGYFTNDLLNTEITYDETYYSVDLQYEFRFDKPFQFELNYNQVVYNTVLPYEFIMVMDYINNDSRANFTNSQYNFESIAVNTQVFNILDNLRSDDTYLRIPTFDIHDNLPRQNYLMRIFSTLVIISKTDRRCLFNLGELDETFQLADDIVAFLKSGEHEFITTPLASVFHIQLFKDGSLDTSVKLIVDSDLNVCADGDLDLGSLYRVMFSFIPHGILMDETASNRLKSNPDILGRSIDIIKLITDNNDVNNPGTTSSSVLFDLNGAPLTTILEAIDRIQYHKVLISYIISKHIKTLK